MKNKNSRGNTMKADSVIKGLLCENTGSHLLDSGGAYGYHYQQNQKVKDWDSIPLYTFDEYGIQINVYPFLKQHLSISDVSCLFNNRLKKLMGKSEEDYYSDMHDFIEQQKLSVVCGVNTYNGESMLSQVLQYLIFEFNGDHFIILQIHNGCDVRGGYTVPYVFVLNDYENFLCCDNHANVKTKKAFYWTDDGYTFYNDADNSKKEYEEVYKEGITGVC